jgi:hypothetical protein
MSFFFDDNPLRANPLQIAVSASSITHKGWMPVPKIQYAVDTSEAGWVFLPGDSPLQAMTEQKAIEINDFLLSKEISGWEVSAQGVDAKSKAAWFVAGTPANWSGTPITIVLVLENQNPLRARSIGRAIYNLAVQ